MVEPPLSTMFCVTTATTASEVSAGNNQPRASEQAGNERRPGPSVGGWGYLVETPASVDGAALDGLVDDLGERGEEVAAEDLRVEEDLRAEEPLVADVDVVGLLAHRLDALVGLEPLVGLGVVLLELLHDVGAHVAEGLLHSPTPHPHTHARRAATNREKNKISGRATTNVCGGGGEEQRNKCYLDALGHLERLGGGDLLVTLTEELQHEVGDVATGQRDVLDAAANDVALSLWGGGGGT
jgi:hypothetical protein